MSVSGVSLSILAFLMLVVVSSSLQSFKSFRNPRLLFLKQARTSSTESNFNSGKDTLHELGSISTSKDLSNLWKKLSTPSQNSSNAISLSFGDAHDMILKAIALENPTLAVKIFERLHDFPRSSYYQRACDMERNDRFFRASLPLATAINLTLPQTVTRVNMALPPGQTVLKPHPHMVTTAIKAYGRLRKPYLAKAVFEWFEKDHSSSPDIYLVSSLLYVLAKNRMVEDAEHLFWYEIPRRGLKYNVVTAHSLMYLYARLKRPHDALRLYEMIRKEGLQCTIVTYGILVKALMLSGDPVLHEVAKRIVQSLPEMKLQPTVELFNQMFEYYAATNRADDALEIQRLMQSCTPPVAMNSISYGHLIFCLSRCKKPRQALHWFRRLREQQMATPPKRWSPSTGMQAPPLLIANEYTYMGVLNAYASLRDGQSAVRILSEMMDEQVRVDQNHLATALHACIVSNQLSLAEAVLGAYLHFTHEAPDVVVCNLWLRVLWQQGKDTEGEELLQRMRNQTQGYPLPVLTTYRDVLQHQIVQERWREAEQTFVAIVSQYSHHLRTLGRAQGSMTDAFEILSFALGSHSKAMKRAFDDDAAHGCGWFFAPSIVQALTRAHEEERHSLEAEDQETSTDVLNLIPSDATMLPVTVEMNFTTPTIRFEDNSVEGGSLSPMDAVELAPLAVDTVVRKQLAARLHDLATFAIESLPVLAFSDAQTSAAVVNDEAKQPMTRTVAPEVRTVTASGASILRNVPPPALPSPTTAALAFTLRMILRTAAYSNINIPVSRRLFLFLSCPSGLNIPFSFDVYRVSFTRK